MRAGFVDGRGRAYDIGFRTLRLSLTDDEGMLVTGAGENVIVQERATASMDILGPKAISLLLPTIGELVATRARVVFLAAAGIPRKEPFTRFNVSIGLHPSAIEHFFAAQGGREFVQFAKEDIESSSTAGSGMEIVVRGLRPGAPSESARFRIRLEPRAAAQRALATLA